MTILTRPGRWLDRVSMQVSFYRATAIYACIMLTAIVVLLALDVHWSHR